MQKRRTHPAGAGKPAGRGSGLQISKLEWGFIGASVVVVLILIVQFMYPRDTALPFARLDGSDIGGKTATQIERLITDNYLAVPLSIKMGEKTDKGNTAQAGIGADVALTTKRAVSYPWWQRLVPLSLPVAGLLKDQPVYTKLDTARFKEFAETRAKTCAVEPKNAGVTIRGNQAVLDPAKNGTTCPIKNIQSAVLAATFDKKGMTVTVRTEVVKPERTDAEVAAQLKQAQTFIDRSLAIKLDDNTTKQVEKSEIATWLTFTQEPTSHDLSVDVSEEKVKAYLESIQGAVYIKPGTTVIFTVDGKQTNIQQGAAGRGVNKTATATAVRKQLMKADGTVAATLETLAPSITYSRSYTATQAGLQALLADIVHDKGDYAIAVRTMNGAVIASANGTKQYHPASTYKMYVGWAIIKQIAEGKLNWADPATGGKNVSQCFDVMIINSDNACGEWLGQKIGWTNLNSMLKGIGLSCTNLSSAWYSCANDESLFLYKLQAGQLLPSDQADRLLSVMKKQVYRAGIPAGVGTAVADKVGFLDGRLHDAAIVYAPHGTYVLTIMTSGSSWSQIADAAKQINAQLNRM